MKHLEGLNLDALYPGRFVKGKALLGVTKIEVLNVHLEQLDKDAKEQDDAPTPGKKKEKPRAILTARMRNPATGSVEPHEIIWCKVNSLLTKEIYGEKPAGWIGKVLFIHHDPRVRFGRDNTGGIRVCGAPANVLPQPKTVVITIKRKVGGNFREEHELLPNGGITSPSKARPDDDSGPG